MAALDMSTPYSPVFAAFYDFCISPAVTRVALEDLGKFLQHVQPGQRILDVGCGGGQHVVRIASERPDIRVVGFDLSRMFLRHAQQRAKKAGVEARVDLARSPSNRPRIGKRMNAGHWRKRLPLDGLGEARAGSGVASRL